MFRAILLSILMLILAMPIAAFGQDEDVKPTQILPEENGLRAGDVQTDPAKKSGPQIIADIALDDDGQGFVREPFIIGGVRIDGPDLLPPSAFGDVIERFIGQAGDPARLQTLARAIADRARGQGYIFASAIIPAQPVKMGIVRVRLDYGIIDQVRMKGTKNRFIGRLFNDLEGSPALKSEVEKAAVLSGSYHGITIDKIRFIRKNGRGVLSVEATDKPHAMHLTVDNYGSRRLGPVRTRVETEIRGIASDSDWLDTQILFTPMQPKELTFISVRYSNILTKHGSLLSLTGAAGRTETDRGVLSSNSRSRYAAINLGQPISLTTAAEIWLNVEGAFLSVNRVNSDGRVREDKIATVTVSTTGKIKFAGGRINSGLSATKGLDILGATGGNDPVASRFDGSGQFTKGELWAIWNRKLGQGFSVRASVNGQIASRPLLSSQEIDIGGPRFGRGFDYSERSGDQGILGSFELRKHLSKPTQSISWLQLYAFADGGYVDNLRDGRGGGSLASAGGGVRAGVGKLALGLEAAVPVKGARDNRYRSPQVNAVMSISF